MYNQFRIYVAIVACGWLFTGVNTLYDRSSSNIINFVRISVLITMLTTILIITRRWQSAFTYLIPVNYLIIFVVGVVTMQDLGNEWNIDKHIQLLLEVVALVIGFFLNCVLFSPTFIITLALYCPVHAVTHFIYMAKRYNMKSSEIIKWTLVLISLQILMCLLLFCTL